MFFRSTGESPYQTLLLREMEGGGAGSFDGSGSGSNDSNNNDAASANEGMLDLGNISGSVTAVDGSDPSAFGTDPNAGTNNGVGDNSGTGIGSGSGNIDAGAAGPFGASNMSFTAVDAQVLGSLTLGAAVTFGSMGAVQATAAFGATVLGLGVGPVSTAIVDLSHDLSIGLGIAVASNPSISMYGSSSYTSAVGAAYDMQANGGVGIDTGFATPTGGVRVQVAADGQFGVMYNIG